MTTTETFYGHERQQSITHEIDLYNQELAIDTQNKLAPDDQLRYLMNAWGVSGEPIAQVNCGEQSFALVDVSEAKSHRGNDTYEPFSNESIVRSKTPTVFEYSEANPVLLVQFGTDGKITGRALRQGHDILIGRASSLYDPKNKRFELGEDNYLSRNHVSIRRENDGEIVIRDLDSTNGTLVRYNSAQEPYKIKPHEAEIKHIPKTEPAEHFRPTTEMLMHPELFPTQEILIDGRAMYLSDVIQGGGREMAVLYSSIEKDGQVHSVPRMLYKSLSDGGWRVAYGVEPAGDGHVRYIKEAHKRGSHYTQETKLHPDLLHALERAEMISDRTGRLSSTIEDIFLTSDLHNEDWFTADKEVRYADNVALASLMVPFRAVMPGRLKQTKLNQLKASGVLDDSYGEYFDKLDKAFDKLPEFLPDFSKQPEKREVRKHSLLGNIVVEDFIGMYGSRRLVWSMAQDKDGRTWIENIRYEDNTVTSYGNYAKIFNAGLLTNKPLEYENQADGLKNNIEVRSHPSGYVDITPLLKRLRPIREYLSYK